VLIARDRGWTEDPLSDRGEEQANDALERAVAIAVAELAVLKGEDNLPEELQDALGFKYAVEAEEWLDAHCTPAGYTMGWNNLSFFFQPVRWWETEIVNGRPTSTDPNPAEGPKQNVLTPKGLIVKLLKIALPIAGLALAAAGCASQGSSSGAASSAKPTVSHSASAPAVHFKYATNAALVAALEAHHVNCGKISQAGVYTECGNNTVIRVLPGISGVAALVSHELAGNGGTVITAQNWVVSTTPKIAYRVQKAVGGSFMGQGPISPQQAAQTRLAAKQAAAKLARQRAARQAARRAANTITYVVTGSSANVTYGPAGTNLSGSVPMNVSAPIGNNPAAYYAVDAQLNGGGTVSVEILVGGKVISSATASGSYNIASAEIDQNPLTGQWENTNSG
jgi:hypothetical protein